MTCDASAIAISGVLSQLEGKHERPISYVSRSLLKEERNYFTYEREALAILYCVKQFKVYLWGRKFTIITDHKPLVFLILVFFFK